MKKILLGLFITACLTNSRAQTGTALNFDGTNDNIRRNIVSAQSVGVTLEARIAFTGTLATNQMIAYNGLNGTNGIGMYVAANSSSVVLKVGASVNTTSCTLVVGAPTLLSVVFLGPNGMQLYVNGTLFQSFFPPPMTTPTGTFSIGGDNLGNLPFNGTYDEVRYWNRPLCAAEIMHRSTCSPIGTELALVAFYNFNQGVSASANPTVTTLMDLSPNNYTATLYNFALAGFTSNWIAAPGSFSSTCTLAPATLTIGGVSSLCAGNSTTINVTGGSSYTWNTTSTLSVISITPASTTQYSVYGNIGPNCTGMALKTISVNPNATVTASSSQPSVLCIGQTATLTGNGASTYTWNPGSITGSAVAVTPTANTTYTVNGLNSFGCPGATTITQVVQSCTGVMQLNNANLQLKLYPNPTNGIFTIELSSINASTTLEIYNAIGQLVMSSELTSYSATVNTDQMTKGIYIVRVKEGNTVIKTTKLIKE